MQIGSWLVEISSSGLRPASSAKPTTFFQVRSKLSAVY